MTHIVIYDDLDAMTQYRQFDDLENAVSYLEELRNSAEEDDAKLFALDEVRFEVKQYFKIEVLDAAPTAVDEASGHPLVESLQAPEILPTAEDVTYVDAVLQAPIEAEAVETTGSEPSEPPAEFEEPIEAAVPGAGNESRRGLFGR